jgi:hypothetical protein
VVLALVLATASAAHGQQRAEPRAPQPRRQQPIEIRGQVPTPQVVTVRPREAPAYSRRVLVPAYFDHDFWPSILPPIEIVPPVGSPRADSLRPASADSARRTQPMPTRPPSGTSPAPRAAPKP